MLKTSWTMIYRPLGTTSYRISVIGQGTTGAGSHDIATHRSVSERIYTLQYGIDLGMTFLDTAESYERGHAEEVVGKAIRGIRDKVFIASKFSPGNSSYEGIMKAFEGSLKRLRTDYIDLYQFQWPNRSTPIGESLSALQKLVEEKRIRFIGLGNFEVEDIEEANLHLNGTSIVSNQVEYNLFNRFAEHRILPYCKAKHITTIVYSPLSQGNLVLREQSRGFLERLAEKYQSTVSQILLNWLICQENVTLIARSMNPEHIKKNAESIHIGLSNEDRDLMSDFLKPRSILVLPGRIKILNYDVDDTHPIYTTLEEALDNRFSLRPGPMEIAEEIRQGRFLKPVELLPTKDQSGQFDYDLVHGRVRYWAWVIAKGEEPIPAHIVG